MVDFRNVDPRPGDLMRIRVRSSLKEPRAYPYDWSYGIFLHQTVELNEMTGTEWIEAHYYGIDGVTSSGCAVTKFEEFFEFEIVQRA